MMCFGMKERRRQKTSHCVIVLLDDTQLVHELHASSTGQDLLDVVIKHLNLLETSYFGLKYLERCEPNEPGKMVDQVWLDMEKSAMKQLSSIQPMTVYFGVKYYAADPCKLAEEITRYQFFLQCKQDILHGRLAVSFDLAVELFALAVQSELGDFDVTRHREGYVSEFQFLANQTVDIEKRVALFHRNLTGQVPATAELNFLERVKWLDLYGCELYPIQYEETGDEYALGLSPAGVLVLRNRVRVAVYPWLRIVKSKCQGRCFLMDVMDGPGVEEKSRSHKTASSISSSSSSGSSRNRFGFRLADKGAAHRLRLAVEEHKGFHHLLHNSASLSQLAHRRNQQNQQQQVKFSQRFRNSIRSAINVGSLYPYNGMQQEQQRLRSSIKSLGQQYSVLGSRAQPCVVRTPSRRYSNRSLARPDSFGGASLMQANTGGALQNVSGAHTMIESQRQQALFMMNQFNQLHGNVGKSQTLKPISNSSKLDSKEAARRNQYYQVMMMMAAAAQQQQQQQATEVSVLPPGRHLIQPSIYRASSVINGIDQLSGLNVQQFYKPRPHQYPTSVPATRGHESPRSTKSAIGTSNAMRLASRKLAKQQQQLQQQMLYGNCAEVRPSIGFDGQQPRLGNQPQLFQYQQPMQNNSSTSANPSPRSVRSARLINRSKSRSTNENLNLLVKQQQLLRQQQQQQQPQLQLRNPTGVLKNSNTNKMLLATAQLMQPPPGYHGNQMTQLTSDNESDASRRSIHKSERERAIFGEDSKQASLLLNTNGLGSGKLNMRDRNCQPSDGDDDYYCSNSDCSSAENRQFQQNNNGPARLTGQVSKPLTSNPNQVKTIDACSDQEEWNAIRKHHDDFIMNESFSKLGGTDQDSPNSGGKMIKSEAGNNIGSQLIKNMANKQATPILLSMNYEPNDANNKAIQLLNLQRSQLNSQASSTSSNGQMKGSKLSTELDSSPSSAASSPNAPKGDQQRVLSLQKGDHPISDSTASNSTSSGYYACSNSTGSASIENESIGSGLNNNQSRRPQLSAKDLSGYREQMEENSTQNDDTLDSGRAKLTLASHRSRNISVSDAKNGSNSMLRQAKQLTPQFYLGEPNNNVSDDCQASLAISKTDRNQQWNLLNQIPQNPQASLKYVSFDV